MPSMEDVFISLIEAVDRQRRQSGMNMNVQRLAAVARKETCT
jgi:hypothetical protein